MQELQSPFARYLRTLGYRDNTQRMMGYSLGEFIAYHAGLELRQIRGEHIEQYAEYLSNRPNRRRSGGLSSSMLHQYLYGLKVFFDWCEQTGKLPLNPMSGYALPKVENQSRPILGPADIRRLYDACTSHRDRALLGLFYGCGLRRSEAERLNAADISFAAGVVYVRKGKGGRRRVVPLSVGVGKDFYHYYQYERMGVDQEAFVLNQRGHRMRGDSYNNRLKALLSRAGIRLPITLHSLRHSIATHLLHQGLSLEQVRDFLGHRHLESTQLYTHLPTDQVGYT